jgi:hypothetical protein
MIVVNTSESFRGKPIRFYYKVTGRMPESLSEIDTKPTIKFLLNCIFPNPTGTESLFHNWDLDKMTTYKRYRHYVGIIFVTIIPRIWHWIHDNCSYYA